MFSGLLFIHGCPHPSFSKGIIGFGCQIHQPTTGPSPFAPDLGMLVAGIDSLFDAIQKQIPLIKGCVPFKQPFVWQVGKLNVDGNFSEKII